RYALAQRIHAHADRGHGAVHAHATRADQVLGLAAGCHARTRQGALQAHQHHSGSAGAGGRSATDSSSSRGSSSRSLRPRISRNCGVVPYSKGRPSPSPRVTTSTSPRSLSFSITAPESTPRISSTSTRPTDCGSRVMSSSTVSGRAEANSADSTSFASGFTADLNRGERPLLVNVQRAALGELEQGDEGGQDVHERGTLPHNVAPPERRTLRE